MTLDPRVHGHAHLVIVRPPFPAPLRYDERPPTTAHDPAAARAAVLSLSTVAAVRHEHAPSPLSHPATPTTRDDLDLVQAAAWGTTIKLTDPALVDDGIDTLTLEAEFHAQRERHPDARIIASCERDAGASYTKILAAVPGAPDLTIEGFDTLDVTGDRHATLTATGIDPTTLGEAYDPDGWYFDHDGFLHLLTGGALSVYADDPRTESTFTVTRTDDADQSLRDVWYPPSYQRRL